MAGAGLRAAIVRRTEALACLPPGARMSTSAIGPQLRAGGGGSTNDCVDSYQNCYVDCSVRYPEAGDSPNNLNALMRQGCFDSCDAACL
jgi:hypothetical protein